MKKILAIIIALIIIPCTLAFIEVPDEPTGPVATGSALEQELLPAGLKINGKEIRLTCTNCVTSGSQEVELNPNTGKVVVRESMVYCNNEDIGCRFRYYVDNKKFLQLQTYSAQLYLDHTKGRFNWIKASKHTSNGKDFLINSIKVPLNKEDIIRFNYKEENSKSILDGYYDTFVYEVHALKPEDVAREKGKKTMRPIELCSQSFPGIVSGETGKTVEQLLETESFKGSEFTVSKLEGEPNCKINDYTLYNAIDSKAEDEAVGAYKYNCGKMRYYLAGAKAVGIFCDQNLEEDAVSNSILVCFDEDCQKYSLPVIGLEREGDPTLYYDTYTGLDDEFISVSHIKDAYWGADGVILSAANLQFYEYLEPNNPPRGKNVASAKITSRNGAYLINDLDLIKDIRQFIYVDDETEILVKEDIKGFSKRPIKYILTTLEGKVYKGFEGYEISINPPNKLIDKIEPYGIPVECPKEPTKTGIKICGLRTNVIKTAQTEPLTFKIYYTEQPEKHIDSFSKMKAENIIATIFKGETEDNKVTVYNNEEEAKEKVKEVVKQKIKNLNPNEKPCLDFDGTCQYFIEECSGDYYTGLCPSQPRAIICCIEWEKSGLSQKVPIPEAVEKDITKSQLWKESIKEEKGTTKMPGEKVLYRDQSENKFVKVGNKLYKAVSLGGNNYKYIKYPGELVDNVYDLDKDDTNDLVLIKENGEKLLILGSKDNKFREPIIP